MLGVVTVVTDIGLVVSLIVLNLSNIVGFAGLAGGGQHSSVIAKEMMVAGLLLFSMVVAVKVLL